ncbi:MAG TPA: hypothetical protein VM912_20330 [Terriglobales bacterium]|nr:hypothetical protein [Terriglobales bacterium]
MVSVLLPSIWTMVPWKTVFEGDRFCRFLLIGEDLMEWQSPARESVCEVLGRRFRPAHRALPFRLWPVIRRKRQPNQPAIRTTDLTTDLTGRFALLLAVGSSNSGNGVSL